MIQVQLIQQRERELEDHMWKAIGDYVHFEMILNGEDQKTMTFTYKSENNDTIKEGA